MYKAVIIDDEPWIIKDLKALVNWKELGFDLAGEANCSSEAEILIDRIKPDLLISDIRMPDMSGIELLQRRRNKGDPVITVFLSAYSDFSYAQQALKLGAYDYLLKPVESKVLEELLCKVKMHLNDRNSNQENINAYKNTILLFDLIEMKPDSNEIGRKLSNAGFLCPYSSFFTIIMVRLNNDGAKEDIHSFIANLSFKENDVQFLPALVGNNKLCCIFGFAENDKDKKIKIVQNVYNQMLGYHSVIGVSELFTDINKLKDAYRQADIMSYQSFITGKEGVYNFNSIDKIHIDTLVNDICKIKDVSDLKGFIKSIPDVVIQEKFSLEALTRIYNTALMQIFRIRNQLEALDPLTEHEIVQYYTNIKETVSALSNILESEEGKKVKHYSNTIIQEIITDIEANYMGKIELNIMANKYYLNPFYLSQLFKKEVGKSFTAYLIETRLNKAADLLKDPRLTLYQVSDMVGYGDYVHFSKIFSKYKGASPTIYRRKVIEK